MQRSDSLLAPADLRAEHEALTGLTTSNSGAATVRLAGRRHDRVGAARKRRSATGLCSVATRT